MMRYSAPSAEYFEDIVESIFSAPDRATAESIVEHYSAYWMEIVGTRGFKGKKTMNANTMFSNLFAVVDSSDTDEKDLNSNSLDKLEEDLKESI